ncbi:MAG: ABC transporter permease [Myxococcota bacterium]
MRRRGRAARRAPWTALADLALETAKSLRAHALRFTLTSLGILWGAAMLTYLVSSSLGSERHFRTQIEKTGPKLMYVIPGALVKERAGERGARTLELEAEDADRLAPLELVEASSPVLFFWNRIVRAGGRTRLLTVRGLGEAGPDIRNFAVAEGRGFRRSDVERHERVALIGAKAKRWLFGDAPALGRSLRIESIRFRIVGVTEEKGDQMMHFGGEDDAMILVPYTTAMRLLSQEDRIDQILLAPMERERTGEVVRATRSVLGAHHRFHPNQELALNFIDVQEVMAILNAIFGGFRLFLFGTGIITLIVGAVGVMNIMIVVVGERIPEIGLRKAVGAPSSAIFGLFLAECTTVCVLSGAVGTFLGFALVNLAREALGPAHPMASAPVWDLQVTAAVSLCLVAVGIAAGVLPALRAARVPPSESLRAG